MFGAYQRWCRTTSVRAQYLEKTLEMCGLLDDEDCPKAGKHRELERANILKSEKAVKKTLNAIRSFTNPFTIPDKEHVNSLSSGCPVSPQVEHDVLKAETIGKAAKERFITDRFINGTPHLNFFDPITRQKLLTMEALNKKICLTTSQGKVVVYSNLQTYIHFTIFVSYQNAQCIDNIKQYIVLSFSLFSIRSKAI